MPSPPSHGRPSHPPTVPSSLATCTTVPSHDTDCIHGMFDLLPLCRHGHSFGVKFNSTGVTIMKFQIILLAAMFALATSVAGWAQLPCGVANQIYCQPWDGGGNLFASQNDTTG